MADQPQPAPADASVRQIASEIFILGFPLLLMDAIRGAHPITPHRFSSFAARASELIPGLFLDDADCVHATAVVDLATGPAVLHVPYAYGRYVSVTLIDAAGDAFASIGTQTMEHSNTDVVIAGPTWRGECPPDMRGVRSPTDLVWAVSRIVAHSAADRPKVRALAARQCLSPLQGDAEATPCSGPAPELDQLDLSILRDLSALDPRVAVHRLPQLIERSPATIRRQLKEIAGERLGRLSDALSADAAAEAAIRAGFVDGWRAIQETQRALEAVSSWTHPEEPAPQEIGSRTRAALALMRLGGPLRQDILTLSCEVDESGRTLNSGEEYRIRFAPSELPPGSAGWRLTAHSAAQHGAAGPVIGDHSPLSVAPDGSIEIQVQREAPPGGGGMNWLRAPEGAFALTLRLYAPAQEALDGRWRVAPVERLGSRVNPLPSRRRNGEPGRRPDPTTSFTALFSDWRMSI